MTDRAKLLKLEAAIAERPQVEIEITHHFAPGVYAREMFVPAGVLLTGKIHKTEHLNILSQGRLSISGTGKSMTVKAPFAYVSVIGTKRAIYAHEDSTWTTIHATEETDLDVIEDMTIAKSFTELDNLLARDDYASFLIDSDVTEDDVQEMTHQPHNLTPLPPTGLNIQPSDIHGTGLFAHLPIKKGTIIALMKDGGEKTLAGRYCNHSGSPNAEMVIVNESLINLIALRDIDDEEITTDYRNNIRVQEDLT